MCQTHLVYVILHAIGVLSQAPLPLNVLLNVLANCGLAGTLADLSDVCMRYSSTASSAHMSTIAVTEKKRHYEQLNSQGMPSTSTHVDRYCP
jgi:hypothetical protein